MTVLLVPYRYSHKAKQGDKRLTKSLEKGVTIVESKDSTVVTFITALYLISKDKVYTKYG